MLESSYKSTIFLFFILFLDDDIDFLVKSLVLIVGMHTLIILLGET